MISKHSNLVFWTAGIDFDGGSRVCDEAKLVDSDAPDAAVLLDERLRDIVHDMVRLGYI